MLHFFRSSTFALYEKKCPTNSSIAKISIRRVILSPCAFTSQLHLSFMDEIILLSSIPISCWHFLSICTFYFQSWKDVSGLAKDFIDKLLVVDTNERMTAAQALIHPWLASSHAASAHKNLHRTISNNLINRQQSAHANSTRSTRSNRSSRSNRSVRSLRSEHRRVQPEEIEQLHKDPDFVAELSSLGSNNGDNQSAHSSSVSS